jgi:hypothetical protein
MRGIFMPLAIAILMVTAAFGAAFAAAGDIIGLVDVNTQQTQRPNTFDSDLSGEYFEFNIIKVVEDASGDYVPQYFSSGAEADPRNFNWSQLSSVTGGTSVDIATAMAVEASTGHWYYYVVAYGFGIAEGPENWHADYSYNTAETSGDFTITTTDFGNQDPDVTEADIQVEFYNGPASDPRALIASGVYRLINANDDYANPPAHGRSYPTALDAVGHAFVAGDIDLYTKPGTGPTTEQFLKSITKNGVPYPDDPTIHFGWMYAVYYSDNGVTYTRDDDDTYIFGPDDYMFKAALKQDYPARVVWALGYLGNYSYYLPPILP